MTGHHLTDEQFAGLLSGGCDPDDHLLECPQCRQELRKVQASLDDFASLSLQWAEQRASASISTRSVLLRGWQSASAWTAAAAAVLTGAVLFAGQLPRTRTQQDTSVAGSRAADSDSEVADDNRLMMAIDKEMRWQPQTLISVDELASPGRRSRETPSPRLTN
jgi:hypothetical protein